MNRRTFIKRTSLASSAFMVPVFLKPFESIAASTEQEQILIIIQLSGGNDGLNTIVPYRNDLYYSMRPGLSHDQATLIKVSDEQAFHPALQPLQPFFDRGNMCIINSVGYPNPDRSHFRSMDIWQTASDADEYLTTGWIGRYIDSACNGCGKPHSAIEVDDTLSLALKGQNQKGMAIKDVGRLYRSTQEPFFRNVANRAGNEMLSESNLGYLYKTMVDTCSSADFIYNSTQHFKNSSLYPDTPFANQLKTISQLIQSGLSTKVYYVSQGSYDTHIAQKGQQERLLKQYAEGVAALLSDLKKSGFSDRVLIMTFSEFGRRVKQNASNGTDHGTANNVILFGENFTKAGFYNQQPDLANLDNGDLKYQIDFRSVYATVLNKWLRTSETGIIPKQFERLNFL